MPVGCADGAEIVWVAVQQLGCLAGAEQPALKHGVKAADEIGIEGVWAAGGVVVVRAAEFVGVNGFLLGLAEQAGVDQAPGT